MASTCYNPPDLLNLKVQKGIPNYKGSSNNYQQIDVSPTGNKEHIKTQNTSSVP